MASEGWRKGMECPCYEGLPIPQLWVLLGSKGFQWWFHCLDRNGHHSHCDLGWGHEPVWAGVSAAPAPLFLVRVHGWALCCRSLCCADPNWGAGQERGSVSKKQGSSTGKTAPVRWSAGCFGLLCTCGSLACSASCLSIHTYGSVLT